MKTKIPILLLAAALAVSCRGRNSMQRGQQQYDVVQEGQATGVTSTINAPGETPPPLTNTNADTTTAFTAFPSGPITTGTMTEPGSLGSTLPPQTTYDPQRPRPAVRPQPVPPPMTSATPSAAPTTTQPAPQPQPQVEPQPQPPATDTTTAPPPPDQPQPEAPKEETEKKDSEQKPPPEPQPPPPPPTPQPPR